MKENTFAKLILLSTALFVLAGCDFSRNESYAHEDEICHDKFPKAKLSDNIFVNGLGTSISVLEAREQNTAGNKLLVEGFIGGRKDPFSANRASFILGDISIETCDKIPGDNCPTPWDACCEERKKILDGSLGVQFLDNNATLIHGNLEGVKGLEPGLKVKVMGIVDKQSLQNAMIINAIRVETL